MVSLYFLFTKYNLGVLGLYSNVKLGGEKVELWRSNDHWNTNE